VPPSGADHGARSGGRRVGSFGSNRRGCGRGTRRQCSGPALSRCWRLCIASPQTDTQTPSHIPHSPRERSGTTTGCESVLTSRSPGSPPLLDSPTPTRRNRRAAASCASVLENLSLVPARTAPRSLMDRDSSKVKSTSGAMTERLAGRPVTSRVRRERPNQDCRRDGVLRGKSFRKRQREAWCAGAEHNELREQGSRRAGGTELCHFGARRIVETRPMLLASIPARGGRSLSAAMRATSAVDEETSLHRAQHVH
jgi:hypothetical protein